MWKKGDIIFSGWLLLDGQRIFNPSDEQLIAAGYTWIDPVPVEIQEKYSTLKIIRALGDDWESYRKQLESAGYLDQFFAANYLAADDPVFMAFMATVPEEVKARLPECVWEEN